MMMLHSFLLGCLYSIQFNTRNRKGTDDGLYACGGAVLALYIALLQ